MQFKQELWLRGLKLGQAMRFRPLGGSMLPFLRQGDIVSISPDKSCRIGDIVLWQSGEVLVLHRVLGKKGKWIITKGDSLGCLDPPVPREQILGRALTRERGNCVRRLDHFVARFLGIVLSLVMTLLPGLIPLLVWVKRRAANLPLVYQIMK